MSLDGLELLPLKDFQHSLIQDGEVSEAREAPWNLGYNGLYLSIIRVMGL